MKITIAGQIAVVVLMLLPVSAMCQQIRILDKSSREPINQAMVFSEDSSSFTMSNVDGICDLSSFKKKGFLSFQHSSYHEFVIRFADLQDYNGVITLSEKVIKMDEVIISANKWEQNTAEIPYEILAIPPKEVYFKNIQTSADLLESTGQVFVQKSQLGGGSPMIRGFAANSVLMVVDGIRMNNAIFRSGNLQNIINIDPNTLGNAEVIFGPGSVIYGSDALGGVMDFHTKKPVFAQKDKTRISGMGFFRYSSANKEKTGHIDLNIANGRWSYLGSLTYGSFSDLRTGNKRTEKFPDYGKRPEYVIRENNMDQIVKNSDVDVQTPSGFNQFNTLQKFSWKVNDYSELGYTFYYSNTGNIPRYDRLIEYSEETLKNAEWYYGPQQWQMHALKARLFRSNAIYDEGRFTCAFQQFRESRHDRRFQENDLRERYEKVGVWNLNIDLEKSVGNKQELFYGLEMNYNNVTSTAESIDISNGNPSPATTRYPDGGNHMFTSALYGSYKYSLSGKTFLSAGLRYSFVKLDSKFNSNIFPYDEITNKNGALNGSLGLVILPNSLWNIGMHVSSGFRAPNVDDVAKVFDSEPGNVIVPNPSLKPEYSYNVEGRVSRLIKNKVKVSIVAFYTFLRNAMVRRDGTFNGMDSILYDGTLSRVQLLTNTGRANIYGGNFSIEADIGKWISIVSYLNYINGEDLEGRVPLRHTTPIFGMTSLYVNVEKLRLEFNARYNGKKSFENLAPSEQNKPYLYTPDGALAWYTLNFRSSYQFHRNLALNFAVENILNHHYRTYSSGISAPGRNYILSAKITL